MSSADILPKRATTPAKPLILTLFLKASCGPGHLGQVLESAQRREIIENVIQTFERRFYDPSLATSRTGDDNCLILQRQCMTPLFLTEMTMIREGWFPSISSSC